MSNVPAMKIELGELERVLVSGDLKNLNETQRLDYVKALCNSLGLSFISRPFEFMTLSGRLTLYAKKDATDQLRKVHSVSAAITSREQIGDLYVVTASGRTPDGRTDESTGAINIANLKGEALANAMMKAETKAKRRMTLSICGLGVLDETEVQDIRAVDEATKTKTAELTSAINEVEETFVSPQEVVSEKQEPSIGDYVFQTGSAKRKGKKLSSFPKEFLVETLEWFNGEIKKGKEFSDDVQEDMFYIKKFLEQGNGSNG